MPGPLPRLSLAVRIAIASALFGFVIIAIGIWVGYRALAQQLDQRSLAELGGKRDLLVHVIAELWPRRRRQPAPVCRAADRA